jgi:alpha-2-macroglobulin
MDFKKILTLVLILVLAGGFSFYFLQKRVQKIPSFAKTYRLVPEKISQSAPIIINLPQKVDKEFAKKNISFEPEIKGRFLESTQNYLLFKPEEKLKLNHYYLAKLTLPDGGEIKSDFLVVEDPKISAIFPHENSESPEDTEITIVFNRPMVPLTSLGYLEAKNVPVEIEPKTEGHFKWISTNVLQFIPKEKLISSSHYTVKIKPGFFSIDGLPVEGKKIKFQTRNLRYVNITEGPVAYNQPISIYFNLPVDLEKTKKEIKLIDLSTSKEIPFVAQYKVLEKEKINQEKKNIGFSPLKYLLTQIASSLGMKPKTKEYFDKEKVDKSIIEIYPKEDRFKREKLWDFGKKYTLLISKAYPLEGDIILEEGKEADIFVKDIIEEIFAESPRTKYADLDLFDPEGKLWVTFFEEIDLKKSKITSKKLKEIGYGKKCKEEGEIAFQSGECEKVEDRKKIYLTFQKEKIGFQERIEINFEKIVNTEGLVLNPEPIIKNIYSFPQFKILKTFPENNSSGANLTYLILCTNTPVLSYSDEDWKKYFRANLDYELRAWYPSFRVSYLSSSSCDMFQFETTIHYGLMPNSNYSLEINLEDVFGQKQNLSLNFKTGEMPYTALNFYHLQKVYNVTTPQNTKLTFAVENMEYINVDICKLSAKDFLFYLLNKPKWYEGLGAVNRCQERVQKTLQLEKKYWIKKYFKFDIKDYFENPLGNYIITFYHPDYKGEYWENYLKFYRKSVIYERSYLSVTNLAVTEKKISPATILWTGERLTDETLKELKNIYWVIDLRNFEGVSGAKIDLYQSVDNNLNFVGSISTNQEGVSFLTPIPNLAGIVVTKNEDSTVLVEDSKFEFVDLSYAFSKIYLYTDKPIYRPGQEVFIKGIYRVGYDGNYEILREKPINLRVINSKGDEILNQDLKINEFGTFNTNLILPVDAPLGTYEICTKDYNCTFFEVLEYVPSPFEVKIKTDKEEYISKETINLEVEGKYYFGVPLEGGEVEYTISSQNYYFDRYQDGSFDFDRSWYYNPPYYFGDKFILRGKTKLSLDGKAKISHTFDLEKLFKEEERKSKIIVVDVTIKNNLGQSVSSQKSFILHAGEFYLSLNADSHFFGKNEKINLRVKSVDIQGKEKKVEKIQFDLYKIEWVYAKRQEAGGNYSFQWEKKRELVKTFNFDTDKNGNYSFELQIDKEGEYEAVVKAKDSKGNLIFDDFLLYVFGQGSVSVKPTPDTQLEVEAEKTNLKVGEEGKIIIKSPYQKAKALISIERGKIFDYQIKEINGNLYPFSFKVQDEYLPNVFVSVLLISQKPEVKFGKLEFQIDREKKELNIEVKSNKKFYLPGEEVTLDVLTKDWTGKGVEAEVSVAVVDVSILALKGNPKKNPLIFFYGGFPLTVSTASNIKNILIETKIPTKGGSGGGLAEESLALKKRGIFKETAFWEATVKTNKEGKAKIKFTLPDNLTQWQTETVGVTKDTKLGVNYIDFVTKKDLMVIPFKPRFVIPGDEFYIGAQIFNQTKETRKVKVKFESQSLILKDKESEIEIKIKPEKSETVYFKVKAPAQIKQGNHNFLIEAISGKLQDLVEQSIKINPNLVYEVTASSNYTNSQLFKEYIYLPENVEKDRGELTIKTSATLAVFLSDALKYLLEFPYGCAEQIASRLNAIAVLKRGLNIENLENKFRLEKIEYQGKTYTIDEILQIGLQDLYNNQNLDGGFSFWRGGDSDFFLTLHILNTFYNLLLSGYPVNRTSIEKSINYVQNKITNDPNLYNDKDAIILTAYTLSHFRKFSQERMLREKIIEIVNDDSFLKDEISNSSLAILAILLQNENYSEELREKAFETLDNKIKIDGRGAFLDVGKNFNWQYFETSIKNTALYLKAQVARKSENKILEKVLRWILNSKSKDGGWGSTQNTLSVIDALTDYLEWKGETKSNFTLEVLINERSEGKFTFEPGTILDQFEKEIPIQNLKFNENNVIFFKKTNHNLETNAYYYDFALKYYLRADQIPPRDEGFTIKRGFYSLEDKNNDNPLKKAKVGEILRAHLQVTVPKSSKFLAIEDFIPAGMEIVNLDLATEQKSLRLQEKELSSRELVPDFKEIRDDRLFLYFENLEPGVYEFDYFVRPLIKGRFIHLPAKISEMYFPENFGRTEGGYFEIE